MGRKKSPGLRKRGGIWHVDKRVKELQGGRLRESTGTSNLAEAERYLVRRLEEIRQATIYGVRRIRTFEEAATKYLLENTHKASILDDGMHLKQLMPFIGELPLNKVHDGALEVFKAARKLGGIRTKSINNALQVVRRILNLAARSWRDEHGLTWIETAPLITMLPVRDARKPYPLDWDEQRKFYQRLPGHLARMALYKVNTGTREQEVCQLRWDWEVTVPELETSVFIVPGNIVKNREDRLIVHNDIAQSVIEAVRGDHDTFVFTYHGRPIKKMNNTAWKHAWKAVGLPVSDAYLRGPHNLKHTLGRRLRAAGVPLETRRVGRNAAG